MTANILMDCSLEISLWDYEKNSGSHFLGGVRMNLGKYVRYFQGWALCLDLKYTKTLKKSYAFRNIVLERIAFLYI